MSENKDLNLCKACQSAGNCKAIAMISGIPLNQRYDSLLPFWSKRPIIEQAQRLADKRKRVLLLKYERHEGRTTYPWTLYLTCLTKALDVDVQRLRKYRKTQISKELRKLFFDATNMERMINGGGYVLGPLNDLVRSFEMRDIRVDPNGVRVFGKVEW